MPKGRPRKIEEIVVENTAVAVENALPKDKPMEWSNKSKYNSFNSYKGLTYYANYKAVDRWLQGKDALPPPIEASIDPIALCNLKCYYCNSQRYLRVKPEEIPNDSRIMSKTYMRKLVDFLGDWGVRGICLGGGGESMLNVDAQQLPSYIASRGMEAAIVTNGTVMNDTIARNMCYCKWVGFSVDAHDAKTYLEVHGVDKFGELCENIQLVNKKRASSPVRLAFKFLILPENCGNIIDACILAKNLGIDDFHVRPVDLQRKDYSGETYAYDVKSIQEQFEECHELEDDKFRVYTVMHKYDDEFHVKHDFTRCLVSPLVIQCCTDGNCYVCVDHRLEKRFLLGRHAPEKGYVLERLKRRASYPEPLIKEWWGSAKHREIVESIKPCDECSRCTWSEYNRQFEEVVLTDNMCLNFP